MLKKLILIAALCGSAFAAPECNFTFTLDNTHTSVQFNNQTHGCYFWAVNYFSSGFSALSLTFEGAPNGINSSTPGTFVQFTGFPVSVVGDNAQAGVGVNSWVRVRLASSTGTGTITGQITGVPLGGTNVVAMGQAGSSTGPPLPIRVDILGALLPSGQSYTPTDATANTEFVQNANNGGLSAPAFYNTFPYKFAGATWYRDFACNLSAPITFSAASGTLQIVGLTATQIIYVCHVSLASDTATNITLIHGTGTNCGTPTAFSGAYNGVKTLALDFGPEAALRTLASEEFCISSSATATIGGIVSYAKY